jgi:hypothetical protein
MILYSVTINIENDVHDEWLTWMTTQHVPEVLQTGLFVENRILKLLNEYDNGGTTYSFQYYLKNMEDYNKYQQLHDLHIQTSIEQRYKNKYVAFRTLLEVIQ